MFAAREQTPRFNWRFDTRLTFYLHSPTRVEAGTWGTMSEE